MARSAAPLVAALLLCVVGTATPVKAQRIAPELRVDALLAREHALHAGVGASRRIARSVAIAALGMAAVAREDGAERGRVEVVGRFLFDSDRRGSTGLYAAGGAVARWRDGASVDGLLTVALGTELGRGGWIPFVEAGLGGGVRFAAGIRR